VPGTSSLALASFQYIGTRVLLLDCCKMRSESFSGRRPRVLFVGSSRFDLPLSEDLATKWDAVSEKLEVRVIGRARTIEAPDPRFRLVGQGLPPLRGLAYYAWLPLVVVQELRRFRPEVIITKSPYEAFALLPVWRLARPRPKLLVDLHGDWRTAPRLYGSSLRRIFGGLTDRAAVFALKRADGTRAISAYTASMAGEATGRTPLSVFPAYFDLESFTRHVPQPLPDQPAVAWIGVLERTKNPRLLADAWRLVAAQTSAARLVVVGRGPLQPIVDELVRDFPTRATSIPRLTPAAVAKLLDDSTLLAMSSESEGLPRVIMEAFARGRPVVATAVGGIPDLVKTGTNGVLVEPGDPNALAGALVRVLENRQFAERLSRGALEDAEQLRWTPDLYATALRQFVDAAVLTG
jgi:glycosyltransferase involved in cell wall biosynthesis